MPVRDGQLLAVALVLPREAQGAPPSVVRAGAPCAPITSRSSVATSNCGLCRANMAMGGTGHYMYSVNITYVNI